MKKSRFGCPRVPVMLKREGWQMGKTRVCRLYFAFSPWSISGVARVCAWKFVTLHDLMSVETRQGYLACCWRQMFEPVVVSLSDPPDHSSQHKATMSSMTVSSISPARR